MQVEIRRQGREDATAVSLRRHGSEDYTLKKAISETPGAAYDIKSTIRCH